MSKSPNASRREFLRAASVMSLVAGAGAPIALNLAAMNVAAAQTAGDYRALICVFLSGGNDQANTVLATDPGSWNDYQRIRATGNASSIALPAVGTPGGVLPIVAKTSQPGRSFALHPSLTGLQSMFNNGSAAVVANVGPLIVPTTLAQYRAASVPLPPKLGSHNDQQSLWQSNSPEGAPYGWGGRMGDLLAAGNTGATFTSISAGGNALFLAGRDITQYQISASGGAVPIANLSGSLMGSSANANTLQAIISADNANLFEKTHAAVVRRSIAAQSLLASALVPAGAGGVANPSNYINPVTQASSSNSLATQLQIVARLIASRNALGVRRQVFFVSLGGFDNHDNQRASQADALAKLDHALAYFDQALTTLPGGDARKMVTLFTASDFGRTFSSNGDGTDHGWGSHHFVVGGAVKGGDVYGSFPVTSLGHDHDINRGTLLPSLSVGQYGATLASWFGLSSAQINDVFPNIGNFNSRNLGFMS